MRIKAEEVLSVIADIIYLKEYNDIPTINRMRNAVADYYDERSVEETPTETRERRVAEMQEPAKPSVEFSQVAALDKQIEVLDKAVRTVHKILRESPVFVSEKIRFDNQRLRTKLTEANAEILRLKTLLNWANNDVKTESNEARQAEAKIAELQKNFDDAFKNYQGEIERSKENRTMLLQIVHEIKKAKKQGLPPKHSIDRIKEILRLTE